MNVVSLRSIRFDFLYNRSLGFDCYQGGERTQKVRQQENEKL